MRYWGQSIRIQRASLANSDSRSSVNSTVVPPTADPSAVPAKETAVTVAVPGAEALVREIRATPDVVEAVSPVSVPSEVVKRTGVLLATRLPLPSRTVAVMTVVLLPSA